MKWQIVMHTANGRLQEKGPTFSTKEEAEKRISDLKKYTTWGNDMVFTIEPVRPRFDWW